MTIVNRLDPTTWPIGWAPENEELWRSLGDYLRKARASATQARMMLEEAQNTATSLYQDALSGSRLESWSNDLSAALEDLSGSVGEVEGWLDNAPLDGEKDPFSYDPDLWSKLDDS